MILKLLFQRIISFRYKVNQKRNQTSCNKLLTSCYVIDLEDVWILLLLLKVTDRKCEYNKKRLIGSSPLGNNYGDAYVEALRKFTQ